MYYLKTAVQSRPGEEVGRRCGGGAAFVALSEALSVTQPRSRFPRQPQQRSPARVEVGEGGGGGREVSGGLKPEFTPASVTRAAQE